MCWMITMTAWSEVMESLMHFDQVSESFVEIVEMSFDDMEELRKRMEILYCHCDLCGIIEGKFAIFLQHTLATLKVTQVLLARTNRTSSSRGATTSFPHSSNLSSARNPSTARGRKSFCLLASCVHRSMAVFAFSEQEWIIYVDALSPRKLCENQTRVIRAPRPELKRYSPSAYRFRKPWGAMNIRVWFTHTNRAIYVFHLACGLDLRCRWNSWILFLWRIKEIPQIVGASSTSWCWLGN